MSVTVYRDGFALITEERRIDLPGGAHRLVFRNVADTVLPETAVLEGQARRLVSNDFRDKPLTARTLIENSVGSEVVLTRTDRRTGRVSLTRATVMAANEGVVFRTKEGAEALYCSGLPEQLSFSRIPAGLTPSPELSVDLGSGEPGPRTLRLTYLATGMTWKADYRATLDPSSARMTLQGWLTLTNRTGVTFRDARVQVIAGRLNLVATPAAYADEDTEDPEEAETDDLFGAPSPPVRVVSDCYDLGRTRGVPRELPVERREVSSPMYSVAAVVSPTGLEEVSVTGSSIAQRESLGDYQLYRLPHNTDLLAHQSKQVAFLRKEGVRVQRLYAIRLEGPMQGLKAPLLQLQTRNDAKSGLGEPLPAGSFWLFETSGSGVILAGASRLQDKAVGLPVEISFAPALDLMLDITMDEKERARGTVLSASSRLLNAKAAPVLVELRQWAPGPNARVATASQRTLRKNGDFMWRVRVPANGEARLRYKLETRESAANESTEDSALVD